MVPFRESQHCHHAEGGSTTHDAHFLADFPIGRVFNGELKITDSARVLAEYVRTGSDIAFRDLVTRYIDLVYSCAFRLLDGDAYRPKDVAQSVFLDLSKMASNISKDMMVGGWVHRHSCFIAGKLIRGERRRQLRESQAAEMNALNAA